MSTVLVGREAAAVIGARFRCLAVHDSERDQAPMSEAETASDPPADTRPRPKWWREFIYVFVVYSLYSRVRNVFGSAGGDPGVAAGISYGHALDVIEIERKVHLFFEPTLQSWYLDLPAQGFIQFWNLFYG